MKKIIFSLFIVAFSLNSCDNALDIDPIDSAAERFRTLQDFELVFNGALGIYPYQDLVRFNSRLSDELRRGEDNGGQGLTELNLSFAADFGGFEEFYIDEYRAINGANRILRGYDAFNLESLNSADRQRLDQIRGQMFALRAMAHFDLMALFSVDFEDNTLAVPYIDFVTGINDFPARNTVAEVSAGILSDLDTAESIITGTDNIFFTQDFITALRARLALYLGDNATAATESQSLIDNYSLANREQYVAMFDNDSDATEVIWDVEFGLADNRLGGNFYFTGTGGAFFEVSEGLYNAVNQGNNQGDDVRLGVIVSLEDTDDTGPIEESVPPTSIFAGKYLGPPNLFGLSNGKAFRISEQYLINAEANAKLGNLAVSAQRVQDIRDARFVTPSALPTYANLVEAVQDILSERRLELALEGHRYLDLKRTRDITGEGLERFANDCGGAVPCLIGPSDFRWALPVPQAEINANPNTVQNPGY